MKINAKKNKTYSFILAFFDCIESHFYYIFKLLSYFNISSINELNVNVNTHYLRNYEICNKN